MEAAGVTMQCDHKIPTWIVNGIDHPHLQWFFVRLRLYRGIVARKGRRFHGSCFLRLESFQKLFLNQRVHSNCFVNAVGDVLDLLFR